MFYDQFRKLQWNERDRSKLQHRQTGALPGYLAWFIMFPAAVVSKSTHAPIVIRCELRISSSP